MSGDVCSGSVYSIGESDSPLVRGAWCLVVYVVVEYSVQVIQTVHQFG